MKKTNDFKKRNLFPEFTLVEKLGFATIVLFLILFFIAPEKKNTVDYSYLNAETMKNVCDSFGGTFDWRGTASKCYVPNKNGILIENDMRYIGNRWLVTNSKSVVVNEE